MNTEKAFDILKKIQNAGNIHIPEKAELKSELITELEEIIPLGKQKEIKELQNTSILFLGNLKKAILAGCYGHCLRDVKFYFEHFSKYRRRDPGGANAELTKGEIDSEYKNSMNGKLIYKDCYGQYLETIWLKDDNNCFSDDLHYLRNTGIREWLTFNEHGITVFLTRLEGKDTCECKQFVKELESGGDTLLMDYSQFRRPVKGLESLESRSGLRHRLLIHANDKNDLPKYFTDLFGAIDLEAEKQSIPQERMKSDIYNWSINSDKSEIYSNGKFVIRLPGIPFKIFKCLHEKKDKFVKRNTLEKCWDKEPSYENYLVDTMNELETKLKNGLKKLEGINVQGKIIESKNNNKRKIIAYKLPT